MYPFKREKKGSKGVFVDFGSIFWFHISRFRNSFSRLVDLTVLAGWWIQQF